MEPSVIGDLLARERRSDRPAIEFPEIDRQLSYRDYLTTAYKAGNVLRYLGVSDDSTVAIDPTPAPEPLLAFLGAAQLGASTTFDPSDADARLILVSVAEEAAYDPAPGTRLAVYGGAPSSPATTHWEKAVWSENPAFPPTDVDPDSTALVAGSAYTHRELLALAADAVETLDLAADGRLAIRTPLSAPETIAGGVIASLLAGTAAVFVSDPALAVDADAAIVGRSDPSVPESTTLSIADLGR